MRSAAWAGWFEVVAHHSVMQAITHRVCHFVSKFLANDDVPRPAPAQEVIEPLLYELKNVLNAKYDIPLLSHVRKWTAE